MAPVSSLRSASQSVTGEPAGRAGGRRRGSALPLRVPPSPSPTHGRKKDWCDVLVRYATSLLTLKFPEMEAIREYAKGHDIRMVKIYREEGVSGTMDLQNRPALYLPPGARYFGCRHCYNLTYRSAQEHDKRVDFLRKHPWRLMALIGDRDSLNVQDLILGLKALR